MNQSCVRSENQLTEAQIQEITNSATEVVSKVFEYSNNLDFETGLNYYSETSNSFFITDGIMHSLTELRKAYKDIGPSVEELHNTVESWHVKVLSLDIVTFTLPVKLKLKLKRIPEFSGRLIWTATLQKQKDKWMIVQSHESWLNCAEVAAAITPANDF
ncbi:nuclear transport factor 2 family protein [Flaviramulus aquimarinus]|uniref:nuclear transport factor 2 family protein n=1 Tax=Flaviramulus aquimarinus TaxID=1170456 RepID=UPI0031ED0EB4